MIPTPALGVRFDIGRLGGTYGLEAWKVFWRAVSRRAIAGALLYEGDTSATLSGAENVFMIAVHHPDIAALQRLAAALNASFEYQAVAATPDLAWNESMAAEPLPEAGRIDGRGALVGGLWARTALEAIKAGGPARPSVEAPASGACPNCGNPVQPSDAFCMVCGTTLTSAAASTEVKEETPAPAPTPPDSCPNCGNPVQPSDVFCMVCGTTLTSASASTEVAEEPTPPAPAPPAVCPNCGSPIQPGDTFCVECGTPLTAPAAPTVLPPPAPSFGGIPVWAWIAIGLVVLLIIGGGVFVLVSGDGDDRAAPVVGPAARPGSGPLAGGYTAEDATTTFQVILVVLTEDSRQIDRVMLDCRPDGESQGFPFTLDSAVSISGDSFNTTTDTLEIVGSFTSETRAEGTIRILNFEAFQDCGIPDSADWTSVCTHRAVLTEEGGFQLAKATSGPCAATGTPIPEDPVRAPGGPAIGELDSSVGELIVEGYREVGEYPPGCDPSEFIFCQEGNGQLLGIVTVRLRDGGLSDPSDRDPTDRIGEVFQEASQSSLEDPFGEQITFTGILPSQDLVRVDIIYGFFTAGSGPQTLNWPGNPELPL